MRHQFIFSFQALVKSKKFYYCILFAILSSFILTFYMYKDESHLYNLGDINHGFFFISSENNNILNIFLICLPLLSILPYGDVYYKERLFINQILTRSKKSHYLMVNTLLAFLSGFFFIFIFLSFLYLYNYLFLHTNIDNAFYYLSILFSENDSFTQFSFPFFTDILYENPALYIWIYIIILSVYAGILSMTTFSVSLCIRTKMITYIFTFAITILSLPISIFLPDMFEHWLPHIIISPRSGYVDYHVQAIILWFVLFLSITLISNILKYRRDVLE